MPCKKGKLKDVALRMVKDSRAYCVISIDGANNVKVAGDVENLGEPTTVGQRVFAQVAMFMYNSAETLKVKEKQILEEGKADRGKIESD